MKDPETNRKITETKIQLKIKDSKKKKTTLPLTKTINNKPSISENQNIVENRITIYPKPYGQPVMATQMPQNVIINNQPLPSPVTYANFTLRPVELTCPYCLNHITSKVTKNCNCCNCLFYFCIYLLIFALCALPMAICSSICHIDCCNSSHDCSACCDAEHSCPNCGRIIGVYYSSNSNSC